ncbi:hypothetical protein V8D89_008694 [Ganoderma adspersum]
MTSTMSAEPSPAVERLPVPPLPEDIIAQVCEELFATPLYQYDLSRTPWGPPIEWSKDLCFLRTIPLVSKLWWKPATRCLYEHIIIFQVDQIPLLVRTLTSKDAGIDFGALVRRIALYECVVYPDSNDMGEDVRTIFERCVALEELSFQRHPDCQDAFSEDDEVSENGVNPVWIFPQIVFPTLAERNPAMLRKLDLLSLNCRRWPEKATTTLYNLILACPRITSFTMQNLEIPAGLAPPVLEYLRELTLHLQYSAPPSQHSARDVWTWGLPNLRSLTLFNSSKLPTAVLERLGRTLTYLYLCYPIPCKDLQLARLSELCPVLEHLVLYPRPYSPNRMSAALRGESEPDSTVSFRNLRHLDVWLKGDTFRTMWRADAAAALVAHARSGLAPALQGMRGLLSLSPSSMPALADLPTICPPSAIARADDTRLLCVYDIPMIQTAWCVRPVDDFWLNRGM